MIGPMTEDELAHAWQRAEVLERAVEEIERRSKAMVDGMRAHYGRTIPSSS